MTSYHGGKQRIGKKLAKIIVDESIDISIRENFNIQGYCEPFVGMCSIYKHIPNLYIEQGFSNLQYKASDINKSVIMMWKEAQKGFIPPTFVSEKVYKQLKYEKDSAMRGYIGFQYSV